MEPTNGTDHIKIGEREFTVLYPDLIPPLSASELADLRASIEERGVQVAVVVDEEDGIIDGIHRLRIASEYGLTDVPVTVRPDLDDGSKRLLALSLNKDRRHLSLESMQALRSLRVERVSAKRDEGKSTRQIAEEEQVSQSQVIRDLASAPSGEPGGSPESVNGHGPGEPPGSPGQKLTNGPGEPPGSPGQKLTNGTVKGRDGKKYPKPKTPAAIIQEWAAHGQLGKRVATEAAALSKAKQKEFVALIQAGQTPADAIKAVSREPGDDPPSKPPSPPKPPTPRGEIKDRVGNIVPDHLRDAFADTGLATLIEELEQVEAMIRPESWLNRAGKFCDHYGFILLDKLKEHAWEALREVQLATEALLAGVPHAVCPKCSGVDSKKNGETCRGCRGYGAVPSHRYGELVGEVLA